MADKDLNLEQTFYPVSDDLSQVPILLKEYGVVVIPNVFSDDECNDWMKEILSNIEAISGNQVNHEVPETWTKDKLPPQRRYGLYNEHILNNLKPVWEIRKDIRMKEIFKPVYSELKGKEVDEFVCSIDGINIQPNVSRNIEGEKDWPHCDQTERDDPFKCVQGQVVLTNSTACFRASPTSHRYFREIMEAVRIPDSNINFAPLYGDRLEYIKQNVTTEKEIPYQVPIRAKRGSVILWFSTTIHSAMSAISKEEPTPDDPLKGWRGIVYVCYRPKSEFSIQQLKALEDCIKLNLGTSHWAKPIMPSDVKPGHSANIEKLVEKPKLVYEIIKFQPDINSCLINGKPPTNRKNKVKCGVQ